MKLALSSEALPGSTPADLARACASRGLTGVELTLEDVPTTAQMEAWRTEAVPVVALHVEKLALASAPELATIAGSLEVPVATAPGLVGEDEAAELARVYAAAGATLLLGVRTRPEDARSTAELVDRVGEGSLGLVWDVRPFDDDLGRAGLVWREGTPHILHVRLRGGGPEQREQDGRGLGGLFVQLALAGYAGVVALTPSDPGRADAWAQWARTSGSSGCGSRAHSRPSRRESWVQLDVRPVEPKDRIDTVLGAYDGTGPGETLRLVVDHDPECIRHLLTATQPAGTFRFEYLERGPEVWRVDVVKQA